MVDLPGLAGVGTPLGLAGSLSSLPTVREFG